MCSRGVVKQNKLFFQTKKYTTLRRWHLTRFRETDSYIYMIYTQTYVYVSNVLWYACALYKYKFFISIAPIQNNTKTGYQRLFYIQQLLSTSAITTYTQIYYHCVSPQPAPSRHSVILSLHWANQSLSYPTNAEHQARKRQISIIKSLLWLGQGSIPAWSGFESMRFRFPDVPAWEAGALLIRPPRLVQV